MFALPTQAPANQMYHRVTAYARRNLSADASVTLVHGSADLYEPYMQPEESADGDRVDARVLTDDAGDRPYEWAGGGADGAVGDVAQGVRVAAGSWLRARGRGILAPITVGTVDQALMAVLPLRRNALRHLGLFGKTVVVDEAHAYDAFTHALLTRLLEWLGEMGVPVVLLSATLTGETARGLPEAYLAAAGRKAGTYELPAVKSALPPKRSAASLPQPEHCWPNKRHSVIRAVARMQTHRATSRSSSAWRR
jgi:CRISPR-associated endonuclease/helicase Cas3